MKDAEHRAQVAVIKWARSMVHIRHELGLLFAIPNGGVRNAVTAMRLKHEGVLAGIPDLFLPVAKYTCLSKHLIYNGLFVEMKVKPNTVSLHQKDVHEKLWNQGYMVAVCWAAQEAIETIAEYLGIEIK